MKYACRFKSWIETQPKSKKDKRNVCADIKGKRHCMLRRLNYAVTKCRRRVPDQVLLDYFQTPLINTYALKESSLFCTNPKLIWVGDDHTANSNNRRCGRLKLENGSKRHGKYCPAHYKARDICFSELPLFFPLQYSPVGKRISQFSV